MSTVRDLLRRWSKIPPGAVRPSGVGDRLGQPGSWRRRTVLRPGAVGHSPAARADCLDGSRRRDRRSGITRLLDRMERDWLVRRTVSTRDRRRLDVTLTPRGRGSSSRHGPGTPKGFRRYFAEPLVRHDVADLSRILAALIQANENSPS